MTQLLPTLRPAPAIAAGWQLGPALLLRVAGQPVEHAWSMRSADTAAWARAMTDLESVRARLAERLRDELTDLVGAAGDDVRAALINLRRDIFNGRQPRPQTLERAEAGYSEYARALLRQWHTTCEDLTALASEGTSALATDERAGRALLQAFSRDPSLRSALMLQSEVLERHLDKYLTVPAGAAKLNKNHRHVERTLLEMLYRATRKTSPFSTLTSVALCEAGTDDAASALPVPPDLRQRSVVRLNVAILARVAAVIGARPELRGDLVAAIAPGASVTEDQVRYARRRSAMAADPDAVVALDSVHESLFFLPSGPGVRAVADALADGPLTMRELAAGLVGGADSPEEAERLLGHLVRLGLILLPQLQINLQDPDPAVALIRALRRQPSPALRDAAAALERARQTVRSYVDTSVPDRRDLIAGLRSGLGDMFEALGAGRDLVPRTLIYEDAHVGTAVVGADRRAWERHHLPGLAALSAILPAFDLNLPRRLTARGFFVARYGAGGRCDDVEQFCHEFQRDFYDPYDQRLMRRTAFDDDNEYVRQENWFKLPEIAAVDDARAEASRLLDHAVSRAPDATSIELSDDFVERIGELLGAVPRSPWSFFVQSAAADADDAGTLVLNQAYTGMTSMFSRFAHGFAEQDPAAADLLRRAMHTGLPDDTVLAELRGGYDTTNLNLHPALTRYELVCPGEASQRPADQQIRLGDLELQHDPEQDRLRLWCPRIHSFVQPVYLGFLMPMALPEIQQVLMCLAPAGMAQIDLWAGTGAAVPGDRVSEYPRITLAGIVVQRRMWKVPIECAPERRPGQDEADWFLDVQRWRRGLGLPDRVFARVDFAVTPGSAADDGDEGADEQGQPKATRKPLAVDFDSLFSVRIFTQLLRSASSRVVLTEALPDDGELWLTDPAGRHYVTELVVETYPKE